MTLATLPFRCQFSVDLSKRETVFVRSPKTGSFLKINTSKIEPSLLQKLRDSYQLERETLQAKIQSRHGIDAFRGIFFTCHMTMDEVLYLANIPISVAVKN